MEVDAGGAWKGIVTKHVTEKEMGGINAELGVEPGDLILLASGLRFSPSVILGK